MLDAGEGQRVSRHCVHIVAQDDSLGCRSVQMGGDGLELAVSIFKCPQETNVRFYSKIFEHIIGQFMYVSNQGASS